MECLLYFLTLPKILPISHINLYYTNRASDSDENALQHDYLCVTAYVDQAHIAQHILSYCMNEYSSKFYIENNIFFPKSTFNELSKQNITSQQLYL